MIKFETAKIEGWYEVGYIYAASDYIIQTVFLFELYNFLKMKKELWNK